MVTVGVVANPASGRDIRRLVAGASVFDNAEKGSMVHRVLAGLGAVGVDRVVMMPAGEGLSSSLLRHLRGRTGELAAQPLPELAFLDMRCRGDASDTVNAVRAMTGERASAIVVLGGDGTHRVVAKHCEDVPLCALSTGTNNAFPQLREATVAGLATGLVATGQAQGHDLLRREKRWDVAVNGREATDCALVDVAVSTDRWIAARALWRPQDLLEAFVAFASPSAVGLSAAAGQVCPVPRDAAYGVRLRLAPVAEARAVVSVPIAPGLVTRVGVADFERVGPGEVVELAPAVGSLALDGEREIERGAGDRITLTLGAGPLVIDIDAVMARAAAHHLLNGNRK